MGQRKKMIEHDRFKLKQLFSKIICNVNIKFWLRFPTIMSKNITRTSLDICTLWKRLYICSTVEDGQY